MGRILSRIVVAFLVIAGIVTIINSHLPAVEVLFIIFMVTGVSWFIIMEIFDWRYLTNHESWESAAGTINVPSELLQKFNTGIVFGHSTIFLNLYNTEKTIRYLGRWTKYHDPQTKISVWHDNIEHHWYVMK